MRGLAATKAGDLWSAALTAKILRLSDYRRPDGEPVVDVLTAVDVAIRDLDEIVSRWGSEEARCQARECRKMLAMAYAASAEQA